MAQTRGATGAEPSNLKVTEAIVAAAKKAFDPQSSPTGREAVFQEFNDIIARTSTITLLPILNALIKPDALPKWLRDPLLQVLTLLPRRPDGVRATLEFVFAVHPSNNGPAAMPDRPHKTGAGITHQAVAVAMKLLSSVPATLTPEKWFQGIHGQIVDLMDGTGGPELAKTAAQIVGFGILGKKQFGAPGAPGWRVFAQPLLEVVNPSLRPVDKQRELTTGDSDADVITLSLSQVVVPARTLEMAIHRLSFLVLSNPSPGLCRRLLKPIILQLWALCSWVKPPQPAEQRFCSVARGLLHTHLRLAGEVDCILPIVQNLLCAGAVYSSTRLWRYRLDGGGGIEVVEIRGQEAGPDAQLDWSEIDHKSAALVSLITDACTNDEVSSLFLHLLRRWIASTQRPRDVEVTMTRQDSDAQSPLSDLFEVTLLQKLMQEAPEKLANRFRQLVDVICEVLKADGRSPLGDDVMAVVLSLVNLIVTAPSFQRSDLKPDEVVVIEDALNRIGRADRPDVSTTAQNLGMLLKYRDDLGETGGSGPNPSARQVEDGKTYRLAMHYINGEGDNPPPVVSEGLNMLSGLIVAESPILDIPATTALMASLLKETEDYINLRVIKVFTQLAKKHPRSTVQELLDHYLDADEKACTDTRLRFGEALVQVVERLGETFCGDVARQVCESLLSIAGRRGYRPKTMAEQARRERLRNMKQRGGDDADEEDEPCDDETLQEGEAANRDMMARIIQGWESKRGSEDVRMRASSLSILGVALETHMVGIEPPLISNAVDLCVSVLALERKPEHGILRRAAVVAILSSVKALCAARESGRTLGFGLTEASRADMQSTLGYVEETDGDGLVRQHARDAVESLESWRAMSLFPRRGQDLGWLAGLRSTGEPGGRRPKIEELD